MLFRFYLFVFYLVGNHRDLHFRTHSFPTRRSSSLDRVVFVRRPLGEARFDEGGDEIAHAVFRNAKGLLDLERAQRPEAREQPVEQRRARGRTQDGRAEEHTSELQSLMSSSYAVFCLKQKKTTNELQQIQTPE